MTRFTAAAFLLVLTAGPAAAAREQVAMGARAVALGGAYSAVADDASAIFWNPAGLCQIGHQELVGSHADLYGTGLQQNVIGAVVPFTPNQAAAFDWYSNGYDDSELDFGENRLDLAWSQRLHRRVAVGVNVKYLSRNIGLDGVTLGSGRGFGLDLGLMTFLSEQARVGIVLQDFQDTSLDYSDIGSTVVYPSSLRLAAAWSPFQPLLLAMDLDDRLHAGVEYAPVDFLAFRAGFQDDTGGSEGAVWSAGTGVRLGIIKFDYAVEFHPDLGETNHFDLGLAFNFNPAQVRIEQVEASEIYTSLYKSYDTKPVARVRLRNLKDTPLTARVGLLVPDLMDESSETEVLLRPRASQDIELPAVLSDKVMKLSGDRHVPVQVSVSYQSARLSRTEKRNSKCLAYAPGAINWGGGMEQAAAFVTTRDPAVDALARKVAGEAARIGPGPFQNRNLSFAAAVISALQALGMAYVPDPSNPFATISEESRAVDTIHYPRETLASGVGDCDDTTVLVSSLLENLGIATRFVDVPGHIFLMFDSGVHERNRLGLPVDESLYVIENETIWVPLETTLISRGFAGAWTAGAESYASWQARNVVNTVDVAASQAAFLPAELPGTPSTVFLDRLGKFDDLFAAETATMAARRSEFLAERFGGAATSVVSPQAASTVAELLYRSGRHDVARRQLETALEGAPGSALLLNNLGVVVAALGELELSIDYFSQAIDTERRDAGIWLNLGLARYVIGDSGQAMDPVVQGLELSGGYTEAARLLHIPSRPDERAAQKRLTSEEVRRLLREAVKRVPTNAALPDSLSPERPVGKPQPQGVRVAAARAGEDALREYLYWKP